MLKFAKRLGRCETDGSGLVDGEKVKAYRDTRGVDLKTMRKLIAAPAKKYAHTLPPSTHTYAFTIKECVYKSTWVKVYRDTAVLTLFCENALRRAEVCKLNVSDFDPATRSLWIQGKGRGTQKERITLSDTVIEAIAAYLRALEAWRASVDGEGAERATGEAQGVQGVPLFVNLDRRPEFRGARLTDDGLYALIGEYGRYIGLARLTPHQLRHSAITAALDATKGNVRQVQKLSRHSRIETLMIYDDNRADEQGNVSNLLSGLLKR
jgi:integrase/recombinase XerC